MKFRILEKSVYNSWYDTWETMYFVQSKTPYIPFWWDTHGSYEQLYIAESVMNSLITKYNTNKGFKKSRKVIKEIEV